MKITFDMSQVKNMFAANRKLGKQIAEDAYDFFVKETPIRTGNARRNTYLTRDRSQIVADYPYAKRLDEGYSKQSPQGMTGPTEDYIESRLQSYINNNDRSK
jgi:hypothetical protein